MLKINHTHTLIYWLFCLPAVCLLCVLLHRLRDHVNNKNKLPILIFPEGKKASRSGNIHITFICIRNASTAHWSEWFDLLQASNS